MSMGYKKCAGFVWKFAPPGQRHGLLGAPSRRWSYNKTRINLTYFSMPDWLAVLSAAQSPTGTGSGDTPIVEVLVGMARESTMFAALDFVRLNFMPPVELQRVFPRFILEYKVAAQQHQDSVADCLDCFTRNGSGRALLAELGRTRHTITVMPHWLYFMTLPEEGFHNSTPRGLQAGQILSHVTDGIPINRRDVYAKGAPIEDYGGGMRGTGKGANVVLYYSVGSWTSTILKDDTTGAAGFEPDEVLYHELAHVTRMVRGQETSLPVEGRGNFGNIEELFATVIADIYQSEKGTRLRGIYGSPGGHPPKDWNVMTDPEGFEANMGGLTISPYRLMETFKNTQKDFYHDLAVLGTPPRFNPAKTHFRLSQKIPI